MGLLVCPWIESYGVTEWPTQEMLSRGHLRSLWVGVLVAVPSGGLYSEHEEVKETLQLHHHK